jgi:L-seryl-tRNA(Ser) seleniumtransferase
LTKAESALVVNNNAAAVLLTLTALCRDSEVIISRGQLIEIGGGFRVPDVMVQSGAKLIEVGTTNRTHLSDYERAINSNTAAILVAHHSNFKVVGFTSEPTLIELARLARDKNILLLYDQGSGAILDTASFGLDDEATVSDALDYGVHLVMFSGDKLIGGPQAGIIVGQQSLVTKLKKHPLARAVRADKMCLAALAMTLNSYIRNRAVEEIPIWQMIARSDHEIEATANKWAKVFQDQGLQAAVSEGHSTVGGGSLPGSTLKTYLVAISGLNIQRLADDLRKATPPIVARISGNQYLLDPRTVLPNQGTSLEENIISCAISQL